MLELGCGAGHSICHLDPDRFDLTGIDQSRTMIDLSAAQNLHVTHHVGDIRSIRLDRTFDAVIAHDALEYMVTEQDLRDALTTAAAHLHPGDAGGTGGLLIAATAYTEENFTEHDHAADHHQQGDVQITHICHVQRHPTGVGVELAMLLLVREAGQLNIINDRHHCGLFTLETWRQAIHDAGLTLISVTDDESGVWFVASSGGDAP